MTDRIDAVVVVFEKEMRGDDAEPTLAAIRQIKGVKAVQAHVRDINAYIADARVHTDCFEALLEAFDKHHLSRRSRWGAATKNRDE